MIDIDGQNEQALCSYITDYLNQALINVLFTAQNKSYINETIRHTTPFRDALSQRKNEREFHFFNFFLFLIISLST